MQSTVPAGCPLSARQWEIVQLLAQGMSYAGIAQHINLSVSAVRTHLGEAYKLLGVHNSNRCIALVMSTGWLEPFDTGDLQDERVTPAQRLYLDAFDEYLRARAGTVAELKARSKMRHHLASMAFEQNTSVPKGDRQRFSQVREVA